jgi:uncharacterized protein (DUF736 family)
MENKYDNSGALFTNEYKKTDQQPDFKGNITINGKNFKLSAWKNKGKEGKNFISLKIDTYEDKPKTPEIPTKSVLNDFLNDF